MKYKQYTFDNFKVSNVRQSIAHVKKQISNTNNMSPINMFSLTTIEKNDIVEIKKNVSTFDNILSSYKNILFICGDYPGYGGAATNCHELLKHYENKGHNVYGFYFNYQKGVDAKYSKHDNYIIADIEECNTIPFKPDLVILRSPSIVNFRNYYKCPIYYIVGGVYRAHLDKYYYELETVNEQNRYINKTVLNQIKYADKTFVNSSHTQDILKNNYGLNTHLFYSSFVPFIDKKPIKDTNFEKRKYKYGLIVSNFNRKIKNIEASINFLKDKENVILIGRGSKEYKKYGFECVDLVDKDKMVEYYKQIQYIVQDSFFESCSNVRVEGLYHGCHICYNNYTIIMPFKLNGIYNLKPHYNYIIGNIKHIYSDVDTMFKRNTIRGVFIDNYEITELGFLIHSNKKQQININDLTNIKCVNKYIGVNSIRYTESYKIDLYYYYGKINVPLSFLGLDDYYNEYINDKERKFNKTLYTLIMSYNYGKTHNKHYKSLLSEKLQNNIFHNQSVLLISKMIVGYGGVQKTSTQLLRMLDKHFNVTVLSNKLINRNIYDFQNQRLNINIPTCLIMKVSKKANIESTVNNKEFYFIINNKLNEALDFKFKLKQIIICHNSMDSLNIKILENEEKIEKVFVINQFHKNLLISHKFKKPIHIYNNYVCNNDNILPKERSTFHFNIAFIGRISKYKNVCELIDGVNKYNNKNKNKKKLTLYIVGDGDDDVCYKGINTNIQFLGQMTFCEINKLYERIDYVISASLTEGKPFAIIEALSRGIPCIHSNINGLNEIITDSCNGFLFNLNSNYNHIRYNMHFDNLNQVFHPNNIYNICSALEKAYNITINKWNWMSNNCINYNLFKYEKQICERINLKSIITNIENAIIKKIKLFVNFKPDINKAYGGGNISVHYLIKAICGAYSDFELTYELEPNIDIYLIIDPFKDRIGHKKYDIHEIVSYKRENGGKIVIRVNDCDKTRRPIDDNRSREYRILQNYDQIDFFIFNSKFIEEYYCEKLKYNDIVHTKPSQVIVNGCDQTIFKSYEKQISNVTKIVTHHWSSNMHKGYQLYYDLWKYTQNHRTNITFTFIGKNVPDMFKSVPIIGPLVTNELSAELNNYHIYITDSVYDSCPNHVLEAISCGLPILYSKKPGGASELCKMAPYTIGEAFESFEELLKKISFIQNNYEFYINNIKKCKHLYDSKLCTSKYYNCLIKLNAINRNIIDSPYLNTVVNINSLDDTGYVLLNDKKFKLVTGDNIFGINTRLNKLTILDLNGTYSVHEFQHSKVDNNKVNILLCSDSNYFVGLFAVLYSVINNTYHVDNAHFNFMIPIEEICMFSNMLNVFEQSINIKLSKTIFYIDSHILDPSIFKSKCYNGGGHLLNIGNLSRLLIGEFMEYNKLIYLDSDSIVQYDIIKKVMDHEFEADLYAPLANRDHINRNKRIIIKMSSILNNYDWKQLIGCDIDMDSFAYMGAPFITNCKKWNDVYSAMIKIIHTHNNTYNGLYKLFTMSLQNIIFYKKIANIDAILDVIQDLGSDRKKWDQRDLVNKDILDWSGVFKPWFSNGLYKQYWNQYDVMKLSGSYGIVVKNKNIVESFNSHLEKDKHVTFNSFNDYIKSLSNLNIKAQYQILYICDASYLRSKMSRVRFWVIETLSKQNNINLIITGPGFDNFNCNKTLQENVVSFNIEFSLVIWYKPLNDNYNFEKSQMIPFRTCLRYNEMWDVDWTKREIDETSTNIIICHHYNDYLKYNNIYKNNQGVRFFYIPHCANEYIFKSINNPKPIDILISGQIKKTHYPLKYRLVNLLLKHKNSTLKNFNIHVHHHPTYSIADAYNNVAQTDYNKMINQSTLCIACTSKHNYRLGKYVEIPMAGGIILGDLPFEDQEEFSKFVVNVNNNMSDKEILEKIKKSLKDKSLLRNYRESGNNWSKNHTVQHYVDKLMQIIKNEKIFIVSDEIKSNHPEFKNEKWICDILKEEFMEEFPFETTRQAKEATIIWYLAPWNTRFTPQNMPRDEWLNMLKTKHVICTQHHIDPEKVKTGDLDTQFRFMKTFGNHIHSICNKTSLELQSHFEHFNVTKKHLWIRNSNFTNMNDKTNLRNKYKIDNTAFLIGSFQKDTEGQTNLPKLSKGPDLFIKIVQDMYSENNKIQVVLTGLRREYIINELTKLKIPYYYFNMVSLEQINELYNCLDLYIVASRCEGGPRSILECGLTKTPIISTKVGIAPELMCSTALFDHENFISYKNAEPNVEYLHKNVITLASKEYLYSFKKYLFNTKYKQNENPSLTPQIRKNPKKHILIGTTATNRSLLHKTTITSWYRYLNNVDKDDYAIKWFINIDFIEKLEEPTFETALHFKNEIKEILTEITETQKGNFLQACKTVSSQIENHVIVNNLNEEDVIVFWLEDDWKLHSNNIPLQDLIENYMSNMTHINLSFIRPNYIHALAPSVLNYKLWAQVQLAAWKEQKTNIDPEHCVGLYFNKTFKTKSNDIPNVTLISQYKKHNKDFLDSTFMNLRNSFYTYEHVTDQCFLLPNYISKETINIKFKDVPLFIRVTSSFCDGGVNVGRNFMKTFDLKKASNLKKGFYE